MGFVSQIHLLALIPATGHRVREHDVFLLQSNRIGLAAFFPNKYISIRLGPGSGDINAPNKPSYGDNTYNEEESSHNATHNGSDVGSLTSRIYSERGPVFE